MSYELRRLIRDRDSYKYGLGNLLGLIVLNIMLSVLACCSTHVQPGALVLAPAEGFLPVFALAIDAIVVYVFLAGTKFGMYSVPLIGLAFVSFFSLFFDVPSYFRVIAVVADSFGVCVLVGLFLAIGKHIAWIEKQLPPDILADLRAEDVEEAA